GPAGHPRAHAAQSAHRRRHLAHHRHRHESWSDRPRAGRSGDHCTIESARIALATFDGSGLPTLTATPSAIRTSARSTGSSILLRASSASANSRPSRSATSRTSGAPAKRNGAELGSDLAHLRNVVAYLKDLGVNAVEIMPLSNVGSSVDWGYLPIGYFGVDERVGKRSDFQALVDICHQHGIAVIVDVVYGHTGVDFPYYDAYTRLQYRENPFMGPFAKDYFSNFGKRTDYNRQLTRDYFFRSTITGSTPITSTVSVTIACQIIGTARWASAMPASFTRPISSP